MYTSQQLGIQGAEEREARVLFGLCIRAQSTRLRRREGAEDGEDGGTGEEGVRTGGLEEEGGRERS